MLIEEINVSSEQYLDKWLSSLTDLCHGAVYSLDAQSLLLPLILYKYLSDVAESKPNEKLSIAPAYQWPRLVAKLERQSVMMPAAEFYRAIAQLKQRVPELEGVFDSVISQLMKLSTPVLVELFSVLGEKKFNEFCLQRSQEETATYIFEWFAKYEGKSSAQAVSPAGLAKLLAQITTYEQKEHIDVYDPTCGSAGLLLAIQQQSRGINCLYGQDINPQAINLAKIRVLLSGQDLNRFNLGIGNSLEKSVFSDKKFDVVLSVPPFGLKNSGNYCIADLPLGHADFAFVGHGLEQLKDDGIMLIVLPQGVLFRGGAEKRVREYLLDELNCVDSIIGLPANLFFNTAIPTCLLVIRKNRHNYDSVLFVDASDNYGKEKRQNSLRDEDIEKILLILDCPENKELYSEIVSIGAIKKNEYNLSINSYVEEYRKVTLNEQDEPFIQYHRLIQNFQLSNNSGAIVFRGMSDAQWELKPSLSRMKCSEEDLVVIEQKIFDQFKQQALPYLDFTPRNEWEWLALAQHHGLPTRLLDWTVNPLIALYFSVENESSKADSVVYLYLDNSGPVDIYKQDEERQFLYQNPLEIPSNPSSPRYIPAHLNQRIVAQSGLFTVHPNPNKPFVSEQIHKIVIPQKLRSKLKQQLYLYGIHEGTIYPGLDGLSRQIKWSNTRNDKN
jgi:type I restriction-modification system DNA methylase subunit